MSDGVRIATAFLSGFPGEVFVVSQNGFIEWSNQSSDARNGTEAPVDRGSLDEVLPFETTTELIGYFKGNNTVFNAPASGTVRFEVEVTRKDDRRVLCEVSSWPLRSEAVSTRWVVHVTEKSAIRTGQERAQLAETIDARPQSPVRSKPRTSATAGFEVRGEQRELAKALLDSRTAEHATTEALTTALICGETSVWSVCPELDEAWMPDECFRQLGYEPGDFIPDDKGWRGLIHPDDAVRVAAMMKKLVLDQSDVFDSEHRVRHKDGSYHWYRTVARKIDRSDRGLPFLISGAFTCIDRIKEDARQLAAALLDAEASHKRTREHQELLRTSGLCAGVGHFSVCPDLGEGWTPDETYRLFGFEPDEFSSSETGWRSNIHPDDLPSAVEAMEDLKAGRSDLYSREHRRRHKDGSYHWYRAICRRVDRSDKGLPYLLAGATIICIDDMKEKELRLQEVASQARNAHHRLDTLADNAPGALFEYRKDDTGRVTLPYFSAKLPSLFGVSRETLETDGSATLTHVPASARPEIAQATEKSRNDGTPFEVRIPVEHPEDGLRWLAVSSIPFPQPDGSTIWFGTVFDVTEQDNLRRAAEAAAKDLRAEHNRMLTMAENVPGAIFEWQRSPDGRSRFTFFSGSLPGIVGLPGETLAHDGGAIYALVVSDDVVPLQEAIHQSEATMSRFQTKFRLAHPEHGLRWISFSASPFRRVCFGVQF